MRVWSCSSLQWFFFPFYPSQLHFDRKLRGESCSETHKSIFSKGYALAISKTHNKLTAHSVALLINADVYICCFYQSVMGLVNKRLR